MSMIRHFRFLQVCGLLLLTLSPVWGQKKVINDVGLMGGASWYFGDLNPEIFFNAPSPAVGIFYRPNLTKRYAIRTTLYYGGIKSPASPVADPLDIRFSAPFSHAFLDFSSQFEFNFLPFSPDPRKMVYSPYVTGGLGYSFVFGASPAGRFVLPFGLGMKINFSERWDGGIEWGFRKTFDDMLDGYGNLIAPGDKSFLHNNDWYSIVGIFVSYKIFYDREKCAAYW